MVLPHSTTTGPRKRWGQRNPAAAQLPAAPAPAPPPPPPSASLVPRDAPGRATGDWRTNLQAAAIGCALVLAGFLLTVEEVQHWFVLPVYLCGCLIGIDAVAWFRGHRPLFDPVAVLGVIGVHFFFLAPLLHVAWDYWMPYVVPPYDWRPWLGYMACLNFAGLCAYRYVVARVERRPLAVQPSVWILRTNRFGPILGVGLFASLVLQWVVYSTYGGVAGYVEAFSALSSRGGSADEFRGMGWVFMVSEAFPMLVMFGYAVYARVTGRGREWWAVLAVLAFFLLAKVYFGGLRGSRAAYIWPMFWTIGIIHLWVRPIPRTFAVVGVAFLVVFMYVYGLYKAYGGDVVQVVRGSDIADIARERKRGLDTTVLGDLGRSDVQSYVLYKLYSPSGRALDYDLAMGRTYFGTMALLIPGRVWPDRPPPKTKEGTTLFYGSDTWATRHFIATFAYGIAGETMLNFGAVPVPVAYGVLGLLAGLAGRWCRSLAPDDARSLMVPFVVTMVIFVLIWDSDVILFYAITAGLSPYVLVRVSSQVFTRTPVGSNLVADGNPT